MTNLSENEKDNIASVIVDFVETKYKINMDDMDNFIPLWDFIRKKLGEYK